jgi:hypothetical protein
VGQVGHGQGGPGMGAAGEAPARAKGGPGSGTAKEAPARAERVGHDRGRLGSGTAREAPARRSGSSAAEAGSGCGGSASSWWRRQRTSQRVEEMRERSGRKKGQGRVYSLMFVGPTDPLTNISRLAYVAAVAPYVRRRPDEHKLYTSV